MTKKTVGEEMKKTKYIIFLESALLASVVFYSTILYAILGPELYGAVANIIACASFLLAYAIKKLREAGHGRD
jgi:hypothetical protein